MILTVLWVIYTIGIIFFYIKLLKKMARYRNLTKDQKEKFKPIIDEEPDWKEKIEIFFGAYFLLLPRVISLVIILAILYLTVGLFGKISFMKPIVEAGYRFTCRSIMFCSALYYIKVEDTSQGSEKNSPFIITNHVSFNDIPTALFLTNCGFVSKYEVRNLTFIGVCAQYIGCIFVQREKGSDKNNAIKLILEHANNFDAQKKNQIVIFPEGTRSNNKCLLEFKKGAFVSLKPVDILVLDYGKVKMDLLNGPFPFCKILPQTLKITKISSFKPTQEMIDKNDWQSFALSAQNTIAKALGIEISNGKQEDSFELREILKKKH